MTGIRSLREDVEELRERVATLESELEDVRLELRSTSRSANVEVSDASGLGCLIMMAFVLVLAWIIFK